MVATIVISVLAFVGMIGSVIFIPHFKIGKVTIDTYWIFPLIAAIILLATSLAPFNEVISSLTSDTSINPLKILVLFFSMTIISVYLEELGLFKYLAIKAAKKAGSNQFVLFLILYLLVAVLTIFTSNDVVILTFTPFICFFAKRTKINPFPYLIAEFAAANTWSMMFIIGNPTNIYLGTSAGINFIDYFKVMAIPTLIAGVTQLGIILLIFFKKLKEPISAEDEEYKIESKVDLIVGLTILISVLVLLIISNYIHLEMYLISLLGAFALLLISLFIRLFTKKNWNYLKDSLVRLPYQLIPFILSMFVIVVALSYQGISDHISSFLNKGPSIWIYGVSSFISANIINNIPMSILFSNLVKGLTGNAYLEAVYSSIIGSNIGAIFTPIGALAGIMFSSLLNKHDIKFSFLSFIKYGSIISIPTLAISLLFLMIVL
ncbi:MAG: ArsB/NhaD family transporter [Candidatus Onthovivens sp.]|nr:ArsB/NhaD family transporter [Candidatus Onthovivens sp.]